MLFTSSPTPVALKEPAAAEEQQPAITSTPTAMNFDADDEDEALQAVLFASLMEEQAQMEAAQQASEKAHKEQEARMAAITTPSLVSKPMPLADFCTEEKFSEEVNTGLKELGQPPHCLMLTKIRGDGHCLFRMFGGALVLGAAWGGRAAIEQLTAHMASPLLHETCREVARLVTELLHERDVLAALNDEDESGKPAQLVAALRKASVSYMRAHAERFQHCGEGVEGEGEAAWEAYCGAIEDPSKTKYGGHPELVALSEALRARVCIHDTSALSGRIATYHLGEHLPETCPIVRGLRRGMHFNLLLQAAAEGDAVISPLD